MLKQNVSNTSERNVSLVGALAIGIGGMVGGGIFAVLGEAVSIAHGATAVAFTIAGIVTLLTAYSYTKLSVTFPNSGGTIIFIDKAFNKDLLSGSVNFMLWLSYLVTISLYAVAFGAYAQTFFPNHDSELLKHIFISIGILLPGIINLINSSLVSKSETIIVAIKLLILAIVIIAGFPYVEFERLSPALWDTPLSIVAAGMVIFVAYEGFELISNSAEDIKNPNKNLPRAFYGSVLFVIALYILIAIITVGSVDESTIIKAKDYALAVAVKPALGQAGFIMVAIAALLATFSAINATVYGNARLAITLAIEGELPKLNKKNTPKNTYAVVTTVVFSLILANFIDLSAIAIIGSASFLLIFSIVNLSAFILSKQINGKRWIFMLAFISTVAAMFTLLIQTYETNPMALIVFFSFIVIAILFELIYGRMYRNKLIIK